MNCFYEILIPSQTDIKNWFTHIVLTENERIKKCVCGYTGVIFFLMNYEYERNLSILNSMQNITGYKGKSIQ